MPSVVQSNPPLSSFEIAPVEAKRRLRSGDAVLLDVRESDEHRRRRIPGAISIPLSTLEAGRSHALNALDGINGIEGSTSLILHCESGRRSRSAMDWLHAAGRADAVNLTGGIREWAQQGFEIESDPAASMPMMRQVQIAAGSAILIFTILAATVDPWFLAGTGFVGAGLCVAGLTGTCGLAVVLGKMPWNRRSLKRASAVETLTAGR